MLTGTKEIYQNYYLTRTDGLINPEELEVGKTIALRDIYYDFDKADLRQESIAELNRLLNLLVAFPKMEIEIGSHTDNRGDDLYNMDLSKRRAESVVNFLISKGIDKSKLMFKGYGETIPIATNTTDEGRQLNRRTEFKIIRL
jgi:outer membrane protein OmpA-like peptidoglycan-associated protein